MKQLLSDVVQSALDISGFAETHNVNAMDANNIIIAPNGSDTQIATAGPGHVSINLNCTDEDVKSSSTWVMDTIFVSLRAGGKAMVTISGYEGEINLAMPDSITEMGAILKKVIEVNTEKLKNIKRNDHTIGPIFEWPIEFGPASQ